MNFLTEKVEIPRWLEIVYGANTFMLITIGIHVIVNGS